MRGKVLRKALAIGVPLLAAALVASPATAADLSFNGGAASYDGGVVYGGTVDVEEFIGQSPRYLRCRWCPPYAHRHYFPISDRVPTLGRREVLPKQPAPPPEDYFRYWSTPPGYGEEPPNIMRFDPEAPK